MHTVTGCHIVKMFL